MLQFATKHFLVSSINNGLHWSIIQWQIHKLGLGGGGNINFSVATWPTSDLFSQDGRVKKKRGRHWGLAPCDLSLWSWSTISFPCTHFLQINCCKYKRHYNSAARSKVLEKQVITINSPKTLHCESHRELNNFFGH